ncbi:MAG: hypothetical protein JXB35_08170 [Anaerolineae bacterium]|nr:hypothetical protein [Anaerolineae bacterium]
MTKKTDRPQKTVTRKQLAHRKRDEQLQRILIWSAVGVGVVIIVLLVAALVSGLTTASKPVAKVGEVEIPVKDYQARVRLERLNTRATVIQYQDLVQQLQAEGGEGNTAFVEQFQSQLQTLETQLSPAFASAFGGGVLETMIEEEIIRQAAVAEGLSVSEDEVDLRLEEYIGYDRAADVEVTDPLTDTQAPMTEAEYREIYESFKTVYLRQARLSEEAFRRILEIDLLRPQLVEAVTQDVETQADQVQITLLITGTEEAAQLFKQRLDAGEDLQALVDELNADENENSAANALSWYSEDQLTTFFGEELAGVAFDLTVGAASAPILGQDGRYYVVYTLGHEVRDLDATTLQQNREAAFNEWLEEQKAVLVERFEWDPYTPTEP